MTRPKPHAGQEPSPVAAPASGRFRRDSEGSLHKVVVVDGVDHFVVRWTDSCSGCFEAGEYCGLAHLYPWDEKAGCSVGSGCRECGYTGKVRRAELVPFDSAGFEQRFANQVANAATVKP